MNAATASRGSNDTRAVDRTLSLPGVPLSCRSLSPIHKGRRKASTLPQELLDDPDTYRSELGPGSYNAPGMFEGRNSPGFSMAGRHSTKGLFIGPGMGSVGYGQDSPGVGKYDACVETNENRRAGPKIGTGPKCPDSNFHLPALSPGPVYSASHPTNIINLIKARRSVCWLRSHILS